MKKAKQQVYVQQRWMDKQDHSIVRVVEVTRTSVRFITEGLEDIILARYKRAFLQDYALYSTPPNTTGALDAKS